MALWTLQFRCIGRTDTSTVGLVKATWAAVATTALMMTTGCGADTSAATSEAAPKKSASKAAKPKPTKPAPPQEQLEDALKDADLMGDVSKVVITQNPQAAIVTFEIADNLTNGMIRSGARTDTLEVIGAAQGVKPALRGLEVLGTYPMQDEYGADLGQVKVMTAAYSAEDLARIQADNVTIRDSIWDLASDGHYLHPALAE